MDRHRPGHFVASLRSVKHAKVAIYAGLLELVAEGRAGGQRRRTERSIIRLDGMSTLVVNSTVSPGAIVTSRGSKRKFVIRMVVLATFACRGCVALGRGPAYAT